MHDCVVFEAMNGLISDRCFNYNLPLTYKEKMTIDLNRDILVDSIRETSKLANRLYLKSAINKRQKDDICSYFNTRANETFVNILRRRSVRNYQDTVECLHKMNQNSMAKILEGKGIGLQY